jgi:serine phosphatase RsbU (regulator of sigma subunit)
MWFATTEGLAVVDPEHLPHNDVPPPVLVEEVRVNQARARDGERLAAGAREFELRYAAPSFAVPERVRFKYRLDGFDADWVAAGSRRVAYYTNLAPGAYTFRVMAANEDGVWNDSGARFAFSVAPYFHQTRTFWAAVILAIGAAVYGVFRLRTRQLHARAAVLEQHVRERTVELSHANAELEAKDRRKQRDLLQAQSFQQRLLPALPYSPAVRFAAGYQPADVVGGDIYDVSELAPGRFRLFLADTTGHGVQASLRTMVLKTEYDRLKRTAASPAALLSALNAVLIASFPALEMRCSAVCVDLVVTSGGAPHAIYANAAHPPMLHVGPNGIDEVYIASAFLGMMDDPEFEEKTIALSAADRIVLTTDGLLEQENGRDEAFGFDRVRVLASVRTVSIDKLARRLVEDVIAFAAPGALADDVAILVAECGPYST